MMTGTVCVFVVRDIATSIDYYRDSLGFTAEFQFGQPIDYAALCRDAVGIHLIAATATDRLAGQGAAAVFVEDVDALYAELAGRGALTVEPPQDRAYGMRDFNARDPDGNQLTFGAPMKGMKPETLGSGRQLADGLNTLKIL